MALAGLEGGRLARTIALGVPLALLGGAYLSEYGFGLEPCEMCWWQRYALFAALPFAVLGWLRPSAKVLTALALLGVLMIPCDMVQWELLGITLAGFNFLISVPLALLGFAALHRNGSDAA